jgi:hypothetical protein
MCQSYGLPESTLPLAHSKSIRIQFRSRGCHGLRLTWPVLFPLQMNTVLNEIKKWIAKYLRKLENHNNALAVNLLDNSETTHRLKSYTVLTLPDRPD